MKNVNVLLSIWIKQNY